MAEQQVHHPLFARLWERIIAPASVRRGADEHRRKLLYGLGGRVIKVGEERYELGQGDSLLGPREVAHAWAHVGEGTGRLIGALQPAGQVEALFDELARLGSSTPREDLQRAFSSHGLELVGPPLPIE